MNTAIKEPANYQVHVNAESAGLGVHVMDGVQCHRAQAYFCLYNTLYFQVILLANSRLVVQQCFCDFLCI